MKIVVFSDTHLTTLFDQKLYSALKKVIESADQVIINGDFWDAYLVSFDSFVNSKWRQLFPLLKSKKTVYIYGNHDLEKFSDSRVALFSVTQTVRHYFQVGKHHYHVEHGHLTHQSPVTKLVSLLPHGFVKAVNLWITTNQDQKTRLGRVTARIEKHFDVIGDIELRAYTEKLAAKSPNTFYIFGHTHTPHFSKSSGYLNPGRFTSKTPGHIVIENLPSVG